MGEQLDNFVQSIKDLVGIKEEDLTPEVMRNIINSLNGAINPQVREQSINNLIRNLEDEGVKKEEAKGIIDSIKEVINEMVFGEEQFTGNKKIVIDSTLQLIYDILDEAVDRYHSYNIVLPMTLAEGAVAPTYAHEGDAAADLYALEDTNLNSHTYGNMVHTGVNIQLPEGWLAFIMPRSGMSKNTPFRISNSVGLIDSGYRGELCVLLDNTSDADSFIRKGDRIAQLLVMPSYRFKAQVVDSLEDSDRGEGGFGSTGT